MQDEWTSHAKDSMTTRVLVLLPFVLAAIVAGYFWAEWRNKPSRPSEVSWTSGQSRSPLVQRELLLMYPLGNDDWHTEKRVIRGFETERHEIQSCIEALLAGSSLSEIRLPGMERLGISGVYLDGRGGLIIDFKSESEPVNVGGVNAENNFIAAILNTVRANFPSLNWVLFLVNGEVSDTLAGHIDIRNRFDLGRKAS